MRACERLNGRAQAAWRGAPTPLPRSRRTLLPHRMPGGPRPAGRSARADCPPAANGRGRGWPAGRRGQGTIAAGRTAASMRGTGGRLGCKAEPDAAAAAGFDEGPPPSVRYIRMFNGFFKNAAMTSTYKVALLRSLADIGGYGASRLAGGHWIGRLCGGAGGGAGGAAACRLVMDLNFAAARFAKFYWDMEVGFGLLHIAPGRRGSPPPAPPPHVPPGRRRRGAQGVRGRRRRRRQPCRRCSAP